jgi:hypothetical protein
MITLTISSNFDLEKFTYDTNKDERTNKEKKTLNFMSWDDARENGYYIWENFKGALNEGYLPFAFNPCEIEHGQTNIDLKDGQIEMDYVRYDDSETYFKIEISEMSYYTK